MKQGDKDSSGPSLREPKKGRRWKRILGYSLLIVWSLAFLGFLVGPKEKTFEDYENLLVSSLIILLPGILLVRSARKGAIVRVPSGEPAPSSNGGSDEPAGDYFALLQLAKRNPQQANFTRLREAYTRSRSYDPMKRVNGPAFESIQALDEGRTEEAILKVENCLGQYFLDMDAHMAATIIYRKAGDIPRSNFHHQFFRGIINSILETGDGKSFDTAYRIIDVPEEYTVLNYFKLGRTERKTLAHNEYMYDIVNAADERGNRQQVYFRIEYSKALEQQAGGTPPRVAEGTLSVVKIGSREWMARNLNVTKFRNGDPIPEAKSREEWIKAGVERKPAWCHLENNAAFDIEFGKLYNWYAATDSRGILPEDWRLPGEADWANLADTLGGRGSAGHSLKSTRGWKDVGNGNNATGFNAQPSGSRLFESAESFLAATFTPPGQIASWWSADERGKDNAWVYSVVFMATGMSRLDLRKEAGVSIRGVRP